MHVAIMHRLSKDSPSMYMPAHILVPFRATTLLVLADDATSSHIEHDRFFPVVQEWGVDYFENKNNIFERIN